MPPEPPEEPVDPEDPPAAEVRVGDPLTVVAAHGATQERDVVGWLDVAHAQEGDTFVDAAHIVAEWSACRW